MVKIIVKFGVLIWNGVIYNNVMPLINKGFTLLELLLVMVIVAMAIVIIVPRMGSNELTLLRVQVREVISVLNYSRRTAIIQGVPQIAVLYVYNEKIKPPKQIGHWASKGAQLQWNDEKVLKPKDENTEELQHVEITFYPEGGCSGGELVLSNEKNKIKITINPLTSKIVSESSDE